MKDKKIMIIICIFIIFILAICTVLFLSIKKKNIRNEGNEVYQKKPDIVIKGTEENPIKLEGFEVTNIDIFKTSDTSLKVKATVVNNTDVVVNGFFIEIGLYDKEEKYITEIVKKYKEEIKPGESYIMESSVVGLKNASEITTAKILDLDKDIKASIQDNLNTNIIKADR